MFDFYFAAATLFFSVEHSLRLILVGSQFSKIILLGGIVERSSIPNKINVVVA
jgi:hypothetical protein